MKIAKPLFILLAYASLLSASQVRAGYWSAEVTPEHEAIEVLSQEANESDVTTAQVMVWNIYKKGEDNYESEKARLMKTYQPHIALFQEAVFSEAGGDEREVCLAESDCAFSTAFRYDGLHSGVATSSQFPMIENTALHSDSREPILKTPKTSLVTKIDFNGQEVMLINTHGINFVTIKAYKIQMDEIVREAKLFHGPILWGGDFNSWAIGRKRILDRALEELSMERVVFDKSELIKGALGYKLDHVFVRGFNVSEAHACETDGSDHRPLLLKLQLKP